MYIGGILPNSANKYSSPKENTNDESMKSNQSLINFLLKNHLFMGNQGMFSFLSDIWIENKLCPQIPAPVHAREVKWPCSLWAIIAVIWRKEEGTEEGIKERKELKKN